MTECDDVVHLVMGRGYLQDGVFAHVHIQYHLCADINTFVYVCVFVCVCI